MAQTAVDFLVKKFHDYGTLYYSDITEAKEMEKERIIDFAKQWEARQNDGNLDTIEMLYNETYNNGL